MKSEPLVLSLEQISEAQRSLVGGKAFALSRLIAGGVMVPPGVCITTRAYERYATAPGLRERMLLELERRPLEGMRWEEVWDIALRIRALFLATPLPEDLDADLRTALSDRFADVAVVVRSSALAEDSAGTSFAGLHESFVNVRGLASILEHTRRVWASLWSDRALIYRKELGLDIGTSAMAVVVQEIVAGERSGVAFGRNPLDPTQAVVEAVHGLNEALVDGAVEPDRWILARSNGAILDHQPASRQCYAIPSDHGVDVVALPEELRSRPPIAPDEVQEVFSLALSCEQLFGSPQDIEWTYSDRTLHSLQSRPITKPRQQTKDDARPWYLTLRRSLEDLKRLRREIEQEVIPGMDREADELEEVEPSELEDRELGREIERRAEIVRHWRKVYWDSCIPFAHGMRLFGEVYNDRVRPDDAHEFMGVLSGTSMLTTDRNHLLEELAASLRTEEKTSADGSITHESEQALDAFLDRFELTMGLSGSRDEKRALLLRLVRKMATRSVEASPAPTGRSREVLEQRFLNAFDGDQRAQAEELLDIGRASYRLRDEDNLYLARLEGHVLRAVEEGRKRTAALGFEEAESLEQDEIIGILTNGRPRESDRKKTEEQSAGPLAVPRQMVGQPAGPGFAEGLARVVHRVEDVFDLVPGEVLVCDAVSPTMTFAVPLAAGIVERRGGMLIHGAIIAREYGIPCVTGISQAAEVIRTGDRVFIDGYLGIVRVDRSDDP